jgi:hypothetical protein
MRGIMINSGNSVAFLAIKYCRIPYILLSCSLKNTYLSAGNVKVVGDKNDIRPLIVMKNKNPVIEYQ